uniref:Uncharacterized protein n=1 Tax=Anguilla anguilla TaxID=7936 RepID=A0A0E9R0U3_ANGAN
MSKNPVHNVDDLKHATSKKMVIMSIKSVTLGGSKEVYRLIQ